MASVKDNSAKIFSYINYQIEQIKADINNTKAYREYCLAHNKQGLAYDCLTQIGAWEWEIKDLEEDKKFYIEYFGFTKQDLNGSTMNGKYKDLDKRVASESEITADWNRTLAEQSSADWSAEELATFERNMGLSLESWRALAPTKF